MGIRVSVAAWIAVAAVAPGCKSKACEAAKSRLAGNSDAPWYQQDVRRECSADDLAARALLEQVAANAAIKAKEARDAEDATKRETDTAKAKALAELHDFFAFAENASKSPKTVGKTECYGADDPDAGWCDTSKAGGQQVWEVRWLKRDPKAVRVDSDSVMRAPLGCADIDASAVPVRIWRWPEAKKTQTHCRIPSGRFAGLDALLQFGESNTFVSLFTPSYLQNDIDLSVTFASQGETLFPADSGTGGNSDAAVMRVAFLTKVAKAMNETTAPPHATGPNLTVAVPSDDPMKCLIWGSSWFAKSAASLRQVGFTELRCGARAWTL